MSLCILCRWLSFIIMHNDDPATQPFTTVSRIEAPFRQNKCICLFVLLYAITCRRYRSREGRYSTLCMWGIGWEYEDYSRTEVGPAFVGRKRIYKTTFEQFQGNGATGCFTNVPTRTYVLGKRCYVSVRLNIIRSSGNAVRRPCGYAHTLLCWRRERMASLI